MREFRTTSLADQVFERLENDIILGVYPKGEILTELKLVDQLGVSRTPIREALRRLEQERLIADSGKGSVVLGITEDDLIDIMNIRQRIEGLAAYYAAVNMTDEGRQELAHIVDLQDFYFSKGDAERLRQGDDQFHDAICALWLLQPELFQAEPMRVKICLEDGEHLGQTVSVAEGAPVATVAMGLDAQAVARRIVAEVHRAASK